MAKLTGGQTSAPNAPSQDLGLLRKRSRRLTLKQNENEEKNDECIATAEGTCHRHIHSLQDIVVVTTNANVFNRAVVANGSVVECPLKELFLQWHTHRAFAVNITVVSACQMTN